MLKIVETIKNVLGYQSPFERRLFDKIDDKDVFYPWGVNGEAFSVNEEITPKLTTFIRSLVVVTFLSIIVCIALEFTGLIHSDNKHYVLQGGVMFFSILYFLGLRLDAPKTKIYTKPTSKRVVELRGLFIFTLLVLVTLTTIMFPFFYPPIAPSYPFIFFCLVYLAGLLSVFVKVYKTKGHYFSA